MFNVFHEKCIDIHDFHDKNSRGDKSMSSSRFLKIAHNLLLLNFVIALLALVSNTYSFFDRLQHGWGIPGMEHIPMWEIHVGSFFGILQLIAVMVVYHFSRKAMGVFIKEGAMNDEVFSFITKLVKCLFFLAGIKILIHFFFPSFYMGTFFDHFLNSTFINRQAESLESFLLLIKALTIVSNFVGLFTFFLNPANCLFFIAVLKGMQKFYQENRNLKTELESVI